MLNVSQLYVRCESDELRAQTELIYITRGEEREPEKERAASDIFFINQYVNTISFQF